MIAITKGPKAAVMAGVTLAGLGLGAGVAFWTLTRPVVAIQDIKEADGVAIRGGWLELAVTSISQRDCYTHVERWFWRPKAGGNPGDRDWVQLPGTGRPPPVVGVESRVTIYIPIPGNIPAGDWHYFSRSRDECTSAFSLASAPRDSPDILVTITDPPVNVPPGPVTITPSIK